MSGGKFGHYNKYLKDEMFVHSDRPNNVMEDDEISELVWDVLELIRVFDYYKCADTGRDTYIKRKNEFKKKWFGNRKIRLEKIVDKKIEQLREEVKEMIGDQE